MNDRLSGNASRGGQSKNPAQGTASRRLALGETSSETSRRVDGGKVNSTAIISADHQSVRPAPPDAGLIADRTRFPDKRVC
jgi:hypothetical protein